LSQVVLSPTLTHSNGHASLIDLTLVSAKTQLLDCSVIPPLVNADHNGLELSFKMNGNTVTSKSAQHKEQSGGTKMLTTERHIR